MEKRESFNGPLVSDRPFLWPESTVDREEEPFHWKETRGFRPDTPLHSVQITSLDLETISNIR